VDCESFTFFTISLVLGDYFSRVMVPTVRSYTISVSYFVNSKDIDPTSLQPRVNTFTYTWDAGLSCFFFSCILVIFLDKVPGGSIHQFGEQPPPFDSTNANCGILSHFEEERNQPLQHSQDYSFTTLGKAYSLGVLSEELATYFRSMA